MPKIKVRKSIVIDAPAEKVYASVRDFKRWREWSPWVIAEPDCPLTYAPDQKSYSWEGKIIGSGKMEVKGEDPPNSIDYELTILVPWKSVSRVRFIFEEQGDGTKVTWAMDGSLPFFLFFLTKMMTTLIGMDYERGLSMLKEYNETGSVSVHLEFPGVKQFPGCAYVGVKSSCPIDEIGPQMQKNLEKLGGVSLEPSGPPFSIYHKWDAVKGLVEYTICVPVGSAPSSPPAGFVAGTVPACPTYVVRHTGPYRHLGNAWSSGIMHARAKVFRQNKKIAPFEIYENDPREVPENELVTLVHFPSK